MFNKRLVELRKQKNLSQYELAEQLGFSRGKLANYEQGTRQPDFETLQKIADFFGVSLDYLLGREAEQTNDTSLSKAQQDIIEFFMKLDGKLFEEQPEELQKVLEQFELYYRMYKEQQKR